MNELRHYGVKGMKWGIRHDRKKFSKSKNRVKIGLQFFAKRASDKDGILLPKKEYAHVMSELHTHISEKERTSYKIIIKHIGKYTYIFENNFDDSYRVIGKNKIKSDR